jgi:hypothetical protein
MPSPRAWSLSSSSAPLPAVRRSGSPFAASPGSEFRADEQEEQRAPGRTAKTPGSRYRGGSQPRARDRRSNRTPAGPQPVPVCRAIRVHASQIRVHASHSEELGTGPDATGWPLRAFSWRSSPTIPMLSKTRCVRPANPCIRHNPARIGLSPSPCRAVPHRSSRLGHAFVCPTGIRM